MTILVPLRDAYFDNFPFIHGKGRDKWTDRCWATEIGVVCEDPKTKEQALIPWHRVQIAHADIGQMFVHVQDERPLANKIRKAK